jgi:hypothetical protein
MSETEIQREILEWLGQQGFLVWRNMSTTAHNHRRSKFHKLGLPDIFLVVNGIFIGIEVKKPGGVVSKAQVSFGDDLERNGARYFIVQSLFECKEILKSNFGLA